MTFHDWIEEHRPIGAVLDVGCGGHLHGTWGLDSLPHQVNGKMNASVIANAARLPVRHGSFDGVVCAQVLSYTYVDPVEILREIHRVLKPGGHLLVTAGRWKGRGAYRWGRVLEIMRWEDVREVPPPRPLWSYRGWTARRTKMMPAGRDWDPIDLRHR